VHFAAIAPQGEQTAHLADLGNVCVGMLEAPEPSLHICFQRLVRPHCPALHPSLQAQILVELAAPRLPRSGRRVPRLRHRDRRRDGPDLVASDRHHRRESPPRALPQRPAAVITHQSFLSSKPPLHCVFDTAEAQQGNRVHPLSRSSQPKLDTSTRSRFNAAQVPATQLCSGRAS